MVRYCKWCSWCSWRMTATMVVFLLLLVSLPSRDEQLVPRSVGLMTVERSVKAASPSVITLRPDDVCPVQQHGISPVRSAPSRKGNGRLRKSKPSAPSVWLKLSVSGKPIRFDKRDISRNFNATTNSI